MGLTRLLAGGYLTLAPTPRSVCCALLPATTQLKDPGPGGVGRGGLQCAAQGTGREKAHREPRPGAAQVPLESPARH